MARSLPPRKTPPHTRSRVRRVAGHILADDQRMDFVGALVGVDALEIDHVAEDRVLEADAVGAEDAASRAGNLEGHRDVGALAEADLLRPQAAGVLQAAELERQELALGEAGQHVDELLLRELERGDRAIELLPQLRV